jgi:hypothetical protein
LAVSQFFWLISQESLDFIKKSLDCSQNSWLIKLAEKRQSANFLVEINQGFG